MHAYQSEPHICLSQIIRNKGERRGEKRKGVRGRDRSNKEKHGSCQNILKNLSTLHQTFQRTYACKTWLSMDASCAISPYQGLTFGDVLLFQWSNKNICVTNWACCMNGIWEGLILSSYGIYPQMHIFAKDICAVFKTILTLVLISFK